jgi:hypothetical protein
VERQKISNEEAAIHFLRACRRETMACQKPTEARLECEENTSVDMKAEAKHWKISKEHAAVETDKALRKRHRAGS